MRRRLPDDSDSEVVGWMISVLGYHDAGEAIDDVLPYAAASSPELRFRVAAALPYLATAGGKPKAVRGLTQLALDEDADIRHYALEGLRELAGAIVKPVDETS